MRYTVLNYSSLNLHAAKQAARMTAIKTPTIPKNHAREPSISSPGTVTFIPNNPVTICRGTKIVARTVTLLRPEFSFALNRMLCTLVCARKFDCSLLVISSRCDSSARMVTRWSWTSLRYTIRSPAGKAGCHRFVWHRLTNPFSTSDLPESECVRWLMRLRRL